MQFSGKCIVTFLPFVMFWVWLWFLIIAFLAFKKKKTLLSYNRKRVNCTYLKYTIWYVLMYIYTCKHQYSQLNKHHSPKKSSPPISNIPSPKPQYTGNYWFVFQYRLSYIFQIYILMKSISTYLFCLALFLFIFHVSIIDLSLLIFFIW